MPLLKKIICVLLLALTCAGCAQKSNPDKVVVHYYPACHEPLAYLKTRTDGTAKAVAGGAIQGGVISGIAGAIIGAIGGGLRPAGILGSVAAGTAVGGLVSGINRHQNIQREDEKHLAKYLEEIDGDINGMNITTAAATVSMQCYTREFRSLLDGIKNGNMDRQSARERFTEIIAGREEAARLLDISPDTQALESEFMQAEE